MYKDDLALDSLQWLICRKTKQNKTNQLCFDFRLSSSEKLYFFNRVLKI